MDPNATLADARHAYRMGRYEEAAHHYANLDAWLAANGFQPDWLVQ